MRHGPRGAGVLIALAFVLASPTGARADDQTPDYSWSSWDDNGWSLFDSSVNAECLGPTATGVCQRLGFWLDVIGDHRVWGLGILGATTDAWDFAGVLSVRNSSGPLSWYTTALSSDYLQVDFAGGYGAPAADPIYMEVGLRSTSTGTADQMVGESLQYIAAGYEGLTPQAEEGLYYTKGYVGGATVTPEPVSMVLLGTGLAGLGALRRRRRKDPAAES